MAKIPRGIEIIPKGNREAARVLSSDAMQFVAELHRGSRLARDLLKSQRAERQQMFDKGGLPDFRPDTRSIRSGAWKAAPPPRDLTDLRCGIVTACSRRDLLMALNSGAKLCLADLADFTSPGWDTLTASHTNLMDRWTSAMEHVDKASGRRMSLSQRLAALMVQPRSLMADEPRVKCDGKPVAAGLFDAGLYLFHNARVALAKASGPYLQLPDVASQAEARLWNDILLHAQSLLDLPAGSIRVHVRIDTLSAAFEMHEIIHELREHISGISPGGLSYGFDVIRSLAAQKSRLMGDGGVADGALKDLLIHTAHQRGILALGPMARLEAKPAAEQAVRCGFDGVWMAHPDHVPAALKVFNDDMPTANQIYVSRDDVRAGQTELLRSDVSIRTEAAIGQSITAALAALESWLSGDGPVDIDGMIEDRASADFHRAHLWQGLRHGVKLDGARKFTTALFEQYLAESLTAMKSRNGRFKDAASLLKALVTAPELQPDLFAQAWKKLT
jgi:malate synthase